MQISESIAAEIAGQLSETIGQNINLMNTDGVIIASSDASRIGKLHGGAKKLIEEGLDYLVVEDDTQYPGSKSGVNLPISIEGSIVGTIGITGPVKEVLQYGKIIKRMTEILLLETKAKEQRVIEQKARDRFYDEWIIGCLNEKNPEDFARMATSLSIDYNKSVRIAVLSFVSETPLNDETMTEISRHVRHGVKARLNGNAFRTATRMVCIIPKECEDLIDSSIKGMFTHIEKTYNCHAFAGIDETARSVMLYPSFAEASRALDAASSSGRCIVHFDAYDLDFMFDEIPTDARDRFLKKLFKETPAEEIPEYLSFAHAYLSENGSLVALSEKLFVHKNTIKYKIAKLTDITGVDIRTSEGIYLFTIALKLSGHAVRFNSNTLAKQTQKV